MTLSPSQIRVLGALMEKEITTPDTYPLSLNALQAACNQRSSRDPVLDLSEDDLRTALHGLEDLGLAGPARGSLHAPAGRVSKFEHHARTAFHLRRDEVAVLCLLLLRGPQTPGELRSRADRLYTFEDLAAVLATLDRLSQSSADTSSSAPPRPLVRVLPRQPGSREARFEHLLGRGTVHNEADTGEGDVNGSPSPAGPSPSWHESSHDSLEGRIAVLERRLAESESRFNTRLEELEQRLAATVPPRSSDVSTAD